MPEASAMSKERQLLWGGLAARCSACSWTSVYDGDGRTHRLPDEEVSKIIRAEFSKHDCADFSNEFGA
jgi:hypothetical protein